MISFKKKITNPQYISKELKYIAKHKNVRQAVVNVLAQFVAIGIGLATVTIIVRVLGTENYGKFSLINTIVATLSIFAGFGFTQAYSRLLLLNEKKGEQQEIIGTGLIIFAFQTVILFFITLLALPLIYLYYQDTHLVSLIFKVNFITSFIMFNLFFLLTTRNLNHMYWQAAKTVLQPTLYFLLILVMVEKINTGIIDVIFASTFALLFPVVIYFLLNKPNFSHVKKWWTAIKAERKRFGFHIYISQIFERVTFNLDMLMLGSYGFSSVAFYDLGKKLTQPISLVSSKFTDAYLKNFNTKKRIPKRVILYNILWWILATVGLMIIAKPIITWLWGAEYLIIYQFLFLMALSLLFANLYSIIFMFLYNKGIGKEQKKHFIIRGILNLGGNILLIPFFNITGAILGTLISNLYFLIGMLHEYKKYKVNNL